MADVTLQDGRIIALDLGRVSIREYRALFDTKQPQADEDATIAKAAGMSLDDFQSLSVPDWRRVVDAFFKAAREPLSDPN